MNTDRMTYSYQALNHARAMGKEINWTAKRKQDHFPIACEVKKLFAYCEENINACLFGYEHSYIKDYFNAAYDYKHWSMKDLNEKLKECKRFLNWELGEIYHGMLIGEYPTRE